MEHFKDLIKLIGLGLVVAAVSDNSVAYAICGGTLYAGGFGDRVPMFHFLFKPLRRRRREPVPPLRCVPCEARAEVTRPTA